MNTHTLRLQHRRALRSRSAGFTLIELMIVVVIVAILTSIAYPSYTRYVTRTSRESAQSFLMELGNTQERIFLNSSGYASSVTAAYTGYSGGGLGVTSGKTSDGKYDLTMTNPTATTFILKAEPRTGTSQYGDGNLTIDQNGKHGGSYTGSW